jgi:hypothetical protein
MDKPHVVVDVFFCLRVFVDVPGHGLSPKWRFCAWISFRYPLSK